VNWSGRTELKTLTQYESVDRALFLQGDKLFLGLYLNELICRIVPESDPHELLFDRYGLLLASLAQSGDVEPLLRTSLSKKSNIHPNLKIFLNG
jgi:DNA repair protein RecO (recombination protein O)